MCFTNTSCFLQGLTTICGAGDPKGRHGVCIYVYTCNTSMAEDRCVSLTLILSFFPSLLNIFFSTILSTKYILHLYENVRALSLSLSETEYCNEACIIQ